MTIRRAWTALMLDLTEEEQETIRARVEREQTTPDSIIVDLVRRGMQPPAFCGRCGACLTEERRHDA